MKSKNLRWILYLIIIIIFIIAQLKSLKNYVSGDENVYFYMGKMITKGELPYRDFFYAHPPLHVFAIASILRIFGFNIIMLKMVPFLSILVSSFFIFLLMEKKQDDLIASAAAVSLFLFSFIILFNSTYASGANMAAMFLVIGFYLLVSEKKYILSGIFFGLASITRLYSIVPALAVMLVIALKRKKSMIRFCLGFFSVFILINGMMLLLFKNEYILQAFRYHLMKPALKTKGLTFYNVIKTDWIIFMLPLAAIFTKMKKVQLSAIISLAYMAFLISLSRVFEYYFVPLFPFLAIIAGFSVSGMIKAKPKAMTTIIMIMGLIFLWNSAANTIFLNSYGFTRFPAKEAAMFITENTPKGTALFGDASITPLVALLSGRDIGFNLIDTNENVFLTGMVSMEDTIDKLKKEDVFVIIRTKEGISRFKPLLEYIGGWCRLEKSYGNDVEGGFLVYDCRKIV